MICPICKEEVQSIRIFYREGKRHEGCNTCCKATPMIDYRVTDDTMGFNIGVGHLKDIRQRRLAPDGSVYRDTKRKHFLT